MIYDNTVRESFNITIILYLKIVKADVSVINFFHKIRTNQEINTYESLTSDVFSSIN